MKQVKQGEYLIVQSGYTNYVQIYKNGKVVFSGNLDVQKSEEELIAYLEEMKMQKNL